MSERPAPTGRSGTGLPARSLRRRVAVMVLVLLALLVLALGVFVDVTLGQRLRSDLQTRLVDRAQQGENLAGSLPPQQLVDRVSGNGVQARLTTGDGEVYGRLPQGSATGAPPSPPGPPGRAEGGASPPGRPGAVITSGDLASTQRRLPDGSVLTVVADGSSISTTLLALRAITVAGGLTVLALAALLIGRVVAVALRPLETMTTLARSITAGDRGSRLRPDRSDTELGRTATAFDEMLEALEGAEGRARAAEEAMRGFLADASHELRTPVAGIQAAAETLLRTDLARAAREDLAVTMVRETRRAARLIHDLSESARSDHDQQLHTRGVDLDAVVREQVQRTATLHPHLHLTGPPDGGVHLVSADAARIDQVLTNLITNAAHATGGSGHVSISINDDPTSGTVVLDVDDDGPGVPPDQREHVFERLVRLDASRQRATGGAGLGLAISRAIARAHGGTLVCLPAPTGHGARFRLTLPTAAHPDDRQVTDLPDGGQQPTPDPSSRTTW